MITYRYRLDEGGGGNRGTPEPPPPKMEPPPLRLVPVEEPPGIAMEPRLWPCFKEKSFFTVGRCGETLGVEASALSGLSIAFCRLEEYVL